MFLMILEKIEAEIKKYTEAYVFVNALPDFRVCFRASINEEDKELLLNDLDLVLPYGLTFSHEYENGHLIVKFKEVVQ